MMSDLFDPSRSGGGPFRRQFVLGPEFHPGFPSWRRVDLGSGLRLTAHPELPLEHCAGERASISILGECLDPDRPGASNAEVAWGLLRTAEACADPGAFLPELARLGGRWALVVAAGGVKRIIHDAAGSRQVHHAVQRDGRQTGVWCASMPHLLAELHGYEIDPRVAALMDSAEYSSQPEYWWPGDRTPYREVKVLLPNHFLDLAAGAVHRYFPCAERPRMDLPEAATRIAGLLQGTVKAAAHRSLLGLSMTAGRDSRIALAASRDVRDRIHAFSFVHRKISRRHPDVTVPARLLPRLGLEHHVVECPARMSAGFARVYARHCGIPHEDWGAIAEGLSAGLPPDLLRMTSTVSEVGRCFYSIGHGGRKRSISGESFGLLTRLGTSPFVVEAFDEWLRGAPDAHGYDVFDLFYWEQRLGCWASTIFSEWDVAHDGFSPFNSREVITTMLAVDEVHRRPPEHALHTAITERLWPEALAEPVNPQKPASLAGRVRTILKGLAWRGRK